MATSLRPEAGDEVALGIVVGEDIVFEGDDHAVFELVDRP
jgi:hypothetical protein